MLFEKAEYQRSEASYGTVFITLAVMIGELWSATLGSLGHPSQLYIDTSIHTNFPSRPSASRPTSCLSVLCCTCICLLEDEGVIRNHCVGITSSQIALQRRHPQSSSHDGKVASLDLSKIQTQTFRNLLKQTGTCGEETWC